MFETMMFGSGLLNDRKKAYVGQKATSPSRDIGVGVAFPDSLTRMRSRPFDRLAERRIFKLFISVVNCIFLTIMI